jgi:magnesium transporter
MITVDDVVHIIQEEAGEDVLLLSGAARRHQRAGRRQLQGPGALADRQSADRAGRLDVIRFSKARSSGWRSRRADADRRRVGGNAGTQTLAVTVRALATNQLTGSNRWRAVGARSASRC